MRKEQYFMKLSCAVCAALMLPLGAGGGTAQAEEAAVSTSNIYYQQIQAPVVQPASYSCWMMTR
ncbi:MULTISPECIES: hypothetical protein [Paenibacillus]|uniref:Uncharacterized protein n=1 Tax=Paenibacillus borealis TaxID=160799 RepID=A0ABX3HDW2_PAEBO|nr:hypothetical protein [Paenibacillus borealis]OMD48706.1 hypothetical protein BSK56_10480 [Paenibacillus borealis]